MNESNEVKREWSIREYREGDEEQIRELRGIALSGSRDSQWWKWMYRDGPAGPALIMLAEAKQKIIGQFAAIPVRLKVGDRATEGGHGFDAMVHPDYRHLGIFKTLSTTLSGSNLVSNRSISYGTPNDQSHPGFVKRLHSLDICEVPVLVKVIAWGNVLKRRYGIPVFAGNLLGNAWERMTTRISPSKNADVEVERVSSFDERIDKFWLKASEIKNIMVIKDMKYLNWRYVAKPGNEYKIFLAKRQDEIAGFIVIKLERGVPNRGFIVDLLTLPGEDTVTEVLTTRAVGYLKEEGAAMISCWMLRDTPYYRTLRKLGFIRRSGPCLNARIFDQNISKEFVTNPSNWYYVMGDDDVI
jgi:hypothetical protein